MRGKCDLPRQTLLVVKQHFMLASVVESDCNLYLTVYRSPVVEETDPLYQPVNEVLGGACFTMEFEYVVEDPQFYYREAIWTLAVIHRECPGDGTPHICVAERREGAVRKAA